MRETRPDAIAARSIVVLARVAAVVGVTLLGAANLACGAEAPAAQPWSGFADIVEKIKPAVISVRAKLDKDMSTTRKDLSSAPEELPLERFFRRFGQPDGDASPVNPRSRVTKQGSGFFILPDGYAVTSNHVIEGADIVEVTTDNGKMYTAKLVGTDDRTDIALIKVDGRSDFPTGNSQTESRALAIGSLRSAIRSASAAQSPPALCRRVDAILAPDLTMTSSRSMLR